MESAIITGTGIYAIPGFELEQQQIKTPFGLAQVNIARKDGFELAYLARHGLNHTTPPHNINFRANLKALQMLGVKRVLATYAVGSINREIPPMGLALLSDFLDFTNNRPLTFYEGGKSGLAHTSMDAPYCPAMGRKILELAAVHKLQIHPETVYVATNGPRFETPAEIRMYAKLGGDVVGMTGVPEVVLARELNMHYAAIAYSINWATGLEKEMEFVSEKMQEIRQKLAGLVVHTLQELKTLDCGCEKAVMFMHPPEE
ncbi:MAG: 5'-methylthioadenosine phosphorylase [Chloroflexi bacterium HGW-Chloroflexi-10]|nr:MAG: 5'-methylthioadenosine phosphorylase [Chloroflexi bacterium HGW-Chloroflexi-10]